MKGYKRICTLICVISPLCTLAEQYKPIEKSNIYYNNASDMIVRPKTMNDASKEYYSMLNGTSVSPNITKSNFSKGFLEVTVPEKMDYPRQYPDEPKWVKFSSDSNVVDFHI